MSGGARIVDADFRDPAHRRGILSVLESYATDLTGGGAPLASDVRERLVPELERQPTALVLLAFAEQEPVGLAVCFFGFSTFKARPLLNVHDLAVVPSFRGRGLGRALLAAVEARAVARGCCKLTLEVLEDNQRARGLYRSVGFADYVLGNSGPARFLTKPLEDA